MLSVERVIAHVTSTLSVTREELATQVRNFVSYVGPECASEVLEEAQRRALPSGRIAMFLRLARQWVPRDRWGEIFLQHTQTPKPKAAPPPRTAPPTAPPEPTPASSIPRLTVRGTLRADAFKDDIVLATLAVFKPKKVAGQRSLAVVAPRHIWHFSTWSQVRFQVELTGTLVACAGVPGFCLLATRITVLTAPSRLKGKTKGAPSTQVDWDHIDEVTRFMRETKGII